MIRILDDSKALTALLTDNTNGLGHIQPISGTVTEELNGMFEAEFTVSVDEKRFSELKVGGILKMDCNESGAQMFRIYEITTPIDSKATVKACHISYDLNKTVVTPFTSAGASATVTAMLSNAVNLNGFTMTTDITNTSSNFTNGIPRYFRQCLGGYEGSLLDVFRGEYEFDNLTVKMLSRRGADNGVHIAYGKNLTDYRQEENNENVYTSVLGYAVVDEVTYTGDVYHKVSSSEPKIKIVDFSSDYQTGQTPTTAELTTKAQTYATNNDIETPKVNISVGFVPLWQADGYKDYASIERVSLGDTVYVDFTKMGLTATARVTKTVWDLAKNRYQSIELGDAKSALSSVIVTNEKAISGVSTNVQAQSERIDSLSAREVGSSGIEWNSDTTQIATTSNNVLYKRNGICWLYLRFTTGATYTSGMTIATLPAGYRTSQLFYAEMANLSDRTKPGVAQIRTDGNVIFSGTRGDASSQYALVVSYMTS